MCVPFLSCVQRSTVSMMSIGKIAGASDTSGMHPAATVVRVIMTKVFIGS